ncbi:hypothetical protein G3I60_36930 [Streptomyces sp. SID13666]|uniref:hypothetical protein n=1 Tax=Streptomyces sp. SID13588 TaxID=2706051 RepID=UPI0013C16077|nr:hypothetical protein [Streptomyces sp. SID13588]NEA59597.1 hypothetical protein [Streptomyces sp. SID13666]NEA75785.1 hypothetical protein [Streptomyces sp. SID13588]
MPAVFDGTKGWTRPAQRKGNIALAPLAGLVITATQAKDGYVLTAQDLGTGAVRWSTTPWWPFDSVRHELPQPEIVTTGGKEYIALSISGTPGEDPLTNGKPTVRIAVYPADASGSTVLPTRTIDIPAQETGDPLPAAHGGSLLVSFGEHQAVTAIDVATGKVTPYTSDEIRKAPDQNLCRGCSNGTPVGVTPRGPLVQGGGGHFWVPGAWYDSSHVPPGAYVTGGGDLAQLTAVGDLVIAGWPTRNEGREETGQRVWAVHDASTGTVKASVTCETAVSSPGGTRPEGVHPVLSPNQRYLVDGVLAFDLSTGKGHCASGTTDKEAVFTAIDSDGTAYGHTGAGDAAIPVSLSIPTQTITLLPPDTKVPTVILKDQAVYLGGDGGAYSVVVYPRR